MQKHFKQKSLIILRSCNELLRRLSRAEDTVFCGRVFIYLFQSFPLGDKSSVNLRGEYHTDNVTIFDAIAKPQDHDIVPDEAETNIRVQSPVADGLQDTINEVTKTEAAVPSKTAAGEQRMNLDVLYPLFWGLQAYFSNPTKLFDPQHFAGFKAGLEATVFTFRQINTDHDSRSGAKGPEEVRKGTKRKRTGDGVEIASSFNPKYLTSRELFDLEVICGLFIYLLFFLRPFNFFTCPYS
jgi:THO complex subunit 1